MEEELKQLEKKEKKINRKFNLMLLVAFFSGIILIGATYAWFYASLNVRIEFFNMIVSDESGLFVSLDGINFGSVTEISRETVIRDLKKTYANHTNQWAYGGLKPVSTNGIANNNMGTFSVYTSDLQRKAKGSEEKYLNTKYSTENIPNDLNVYIAFDLFLKNVSGSPFPDNLYIVEGTSITLENEEDGDADGTINSMRLGMVRINSTPSTSSVDVIQNLKCNNACKMMIYEPYSTKHSEESIERATKYNIRLVDGRYSPTYAVIAEGNDLELANGQEGSGYPLDREHFAFQDTIQTFDNPLFSLPNGITKFRVYVWLEGQDMDSLETLSKGSKIKIVINFYKDLAGYY